MIPANTCAGCSCALFFVTCMQLSAIHMQFSVFDIQLSMICAQLSVISVQLSAICVQLSLMLAGNQCRHTYACEVQANSM